MISIEAELLGSTNKSGSEAVERIKLMPSANNEPDEEICTGVKASTISVLDNSILELRYSPRTKPPQRAPNPVDDKVDSPASNVPFTTIFTASDILNDTPSSIFRVLNCGIIRSSSR